jgi:hypothetical protein
MRQKATAHCGKLGVRIKFCGTCVIKQGVPFFLVIWDSSGVVCQKIISFCFYNEVCRHVEASITINAEIVAILLIELFFVH